MNGWVKVRRGLADHIPSLPDSELRVYLTMLIHARATGPDRGIFLGDQRELSRLAGCSPTRISRAIRGLTERGWVEKIAAKGYLILKFDDCGSATQIAVAQSPVAVAQSELRQRNSNCGSATALLITKEEEKKRRTGGLDIDYEEELARICEAYPKKTKVTDAKNYYHTRIVDEVNFPAWLERVKRNVSICAATPASRVKFLPNMNDFLRNPDDDYEALVRSHCEEAGEPYRVTDTARADEMARVLAEVGEDLL